jgi:hypothetical protein
MVGGGFVLYGASRSRELPGEGSMRNKSTMPTLTRRWAAAAVLLLATAFLSSTENMTASLPVALAQQPPSFTEFLRHNVTPISQTDGATNFVWKVGDYDADGWPDVYGIKVRNTGTNNVEVHVLDWKTDYSTFLFQDRTPISVADGDANFLWVVHDYNADGVSDLVGIKVRNTASRNIEVYVLDGANRFSTYLLPGAVTPISTVEDTHFDWSIGNRTFGARHPDIYPIKIRGTQFDTVELHALDGSQQYGSFSVHSVSLVRGAQGASDFFWDVDSRDFFHALYGIRSRGTESGQVEVQQMRPSGYQASATAISAQDGSDNLVWALADWNNDSNVDLFGFKVRNTGTGKVEVHVLDGR